ncbi:SDR family oxidoreductase [Vibrio sp. SM6]|uniref:SDR family oxidoreductase n=1 Tax=Vibrio agarilyticus TaxID=2726741 RepID=A0A7X8YIA3_9VIBR|nr:SDR family oxidoreductase [Vibrio agarilyticus]NLS14499.1 SDR family oxidoreductase [Vibrio agarilyticus]
MDIRNALVLVTNAGSVLGRTTASHFAQLGGTLILCDEDKSKLDRTHHDLLTITRQVHSFHLKENDANGIQRLFQQIINEFGRAPNVLLNCWTSTPMPTLICDDDADDALRELTTTAKTLYGFSRVCAKQMQNANTSGVIVNVICCGGHQQLTGLDNVISLVSGFTHSWARDLTPFNIRVGGVVPSTNREYDHCSANHWSEIHDELVRNTAYIVGNDYFSGRVMTANI